MCLGIVFVDILLVDDALVILSPNVSYGSGIKELGWVATFLSARKVLYISSWDIEFSMLEIFCSERYREDDVMSCVGRPSCMLTCLRSVGVWTIIVW